MCIQQCWKYFFGWTVLINISSAENIDCIYRVIVQAHSNMAWSRAVQWAITNLDQALLILKNRKNIQEETGPRPILFLAHSSPDVPNSPLLSIAATPKFPQPMFSPSDLSLSKKNYSKKRKKNFFSLFRETEGEKNSEAVGGDGGAGGGGGGGAAGAGGGGGGVRRRRPRAPGPPAPPRRPRAAPHRRRLLAAGPPRLAPLPSSPGALSLAALAGSPSLPIAVAGRGWKTRAIDPPAGRPPGAVCPVVSK